MKTIKIGSGAGFAGDRLDPALHLMRTVDLDYIAFECLAERTIALAQLDKLKNPDKGYDPLLEYRMREVLPLAVARNIKVLTNMGAANPIAAAQRVLEWSRELNLKGLRVAAISGDDVRELVLEHPDLLQLENGRPVREVFPHLVSANAYLGTAPLVRALELGADLIISGRVADPALFLAPMIHELGWKREQLECLGTGTLVGHLLECAGQVTGGYYSSPGNVEVLDLWNLGFPYAEINQEGNGYISKAPHTGGMVSKATCTEQLLYEIHDPSRYITPDCIADFSKVEFKSMEPNRIAFSGASSYLPTDTFKVSVGYRNGFLGEAQISYGGYNAMGKATLAGDIVKKRLEIRGIGVQDMRVELLGVNSINPLNNPGHSEPLEIRLRVAGRTQTREEADILTQEVESLYTNGPAAGGGVVKRTQELVSMTSVLLPKHLVTPTVTIESA